ncbi:MAG: hypothetical protein V3T51_04135 [Gammaproteobacteria bacterium]
MFKKKELTPLAVAISAALVASLGSISAVSADSSPFVAKSLTSGYMAAAMGEGSCGGDKGKEGSCGGDKEKEGDAEEGEGGGEGEDKGEEGSCGGDKGEEGSCGGDKGEEGKCGGTV